MTNVELAEAFGKSAAALIGLPLFVVAQILVWKWLPARRKGVLLLVITASTCYAVATALLWLARIAPIQWHMWTSLPAFAFGTVAYMHLYFGIDRSLSVRILGELTRSKTGSLSQAELENVYPVDDMLQRRLDVLVFKGLLLRESSFYTCTPRGRFIARIALLGKKLYALEATG